MYYGLEPPAAYSSQGRVRLGIGSVLEGIVSEAFQVCKLPV